MSFTNPVRLRSCCGMLLLLLLAAGCRAVAPSRSFEAQEGLVFAEAQERADEVGQMLDELAPRVLEILPDSRLDAVEVWVQDEPEVYSFAGPSYEEADGLWVESSGRIHLRDGASNVKRTLAHELVHASLGESWRALPGTIEEGLCDWISAQLCPGGAVEMRAGRLSAACFATGGLELVVEASWGGASEARSRLSAQIVLCASEEEELSPEDVFVVRAGLSSTRMGSAHKKAFYGLSFLLVERIVERRGLLGLHQLCLESEARGEPEIPAPRLLEAAGLAGADRQEWRRAMHQALGEEEFSLLLRRYPSSLLAAVDELLGPESPAQLIAGELDVRFRLPSEARSFGNLR